MISTMHIGNLYGEIFVDSREILAKKRKACLIDF